MSEAVVAKQTYSPHPKQALAHKAFLVDGFDRGCLFWGRQVGKSIWSVKHLELAACYKQGQYFIVFNTHKHAKDVMWRQYLHMIPKELIYETNSTDLTITFNYIKMPIFIPGVGWQAIIHDIGKPRSSIQLLGSDYADDHRGRKADGIIFDEYQDQDPNNWEAVYKYFFTTTKGWACFMGTAKGYNHWYELLEFAKQESNKRWYYLEATWRDNPLIDPAWIEAERDEAEKTDQLDIFMQEVELQFRTVQGSVFGRFDRNFHVIKPSDIRLPVDATTYVCVDFGWVEGHPTAANIVDIDGMGKWFVTDEVHGTEIEMSTLARQIYEKLAGRRVSAVICDSARPDLIAQLRKELSKYIAYVRVIAASKQPVNSVSSITTGIQLLSAMIRPKLQITGMPEPDFYIVENCSHTIFDFENYKYKEHKKDRPVSDMPVKMNDDHCDGLRYLKLYLKYGIQKQSKPIESTIKFNNYGLLS